MHTFILSTETSDRQISSWEGRDRSHFIATLPPPQKNKLGLEHTPWTETVRGRREDPQVIIPKHQG